MHDLISTARALADDLLFPAAGAVDRDGAVPASHLRALADAGMYGIAAPADAGGPGLTTSQVGAVFEALAGGCLATTFLWGQHHGLVRSLASTPDSDLRDRHLLPAMRGELTGGVAFAGAIADPPRMRARREPGGWRLSGVAPFVSGWGVVDVLTVAAVDEDGKIVNALVDAVSGPGVVAEPMALVAAQGSATVALRLDGLWVPDARVLDRSTREDFLDVHAWGARINGSLPVGVARRSARLLDDLGRTAEATRLVAACDRVTAALDAGATDREMRTRARADASLLAHRATAALVATVGGRGLLREATAQRLAREATFCLVAAVRDDVRTLLLDDLTG